jgi:hypothetical protein
MWKKNFHQNLLNKASHFVNMLLFCYESKGKRFELCFHSNRIRSRSRQRRVVPSFYILNLQSYSADRCVPGFIKAVIEKNAVFSVGRTGPLRA